MQMSDLRSESFSRIGIGAVLNKLNRFDDARIELHHAIKCGERFGHANQSWMAWQHINYLEQASGNSQAACEARQKALAAYLAYRRDGGENHSGVGRLCLAVGQAIQQGDTGEVEQVIERLLTRDDWQDNKEFLRKLQAIIGGERDRALAEDEGLHYEEAAELILLLEGLGES